MAAGAESYRRNESLGLAIATAISATQHIMKSFINRTSSIECGDITSCDFSNKISFAKYFFTGKFLSCYILAGKWAPEAIKAAEEGLSMEKKEQDHQSLSCASEVVRKMGANDEQAVMVAGFAGGLGLSGSGCGALAAAIWMNALLKNRDQNEKSVSFNPDADPTLQAFFKETDYEVECEKICGQKFRSIYDHSEFIKNGGCKKLISVLAETTHQPSKNTTPRVEAKVL